MDLSSATEAGKYSIENELNIDGQAMAGSSNVTREECNPMNGIYYPVLSAIAFFFINKLVAWYGPPKSIDCDFWMWRNIFLSWLHAAVIGAWNASCYYYYPDMWDDLLLFRTTYSYVMISISSGYFVYDFFDIIVAGKSRSMYEVLCHHTVVTFMFVYDLIICENIGFTIVALAAEISSFFLHSRKLMQLLRVDYDHWVYRINCVFNIIAFVFGRFVAMGCITYYMVVWYHRQGFVYMICLTVTMSILWIINPILFWRLLKNDFFRSRKSDSKSRSSNGHPNGVVTNSSTRKDHIY